MSHVHAASGHVFRRDGRRGSVWYAKYRLPDGRQVQQRIGPAFTGRGRPADGTFTERTARAALDRLLDAAEEGTLPALRDLRAGEVRQREEACARTRARRG